MSPKEMSDQPITYGNLQKALMEFHHVVFLPDVRRVVEEAVGASERRLLDEIMGHVDGLAHKIVNLETEMRLGFAQINERLDRLEARMDRLEARTDGVEGRLTVLERQYADLLASMHRLDARLRHVESQIDQIAAAQEKLALRSEIAELGRRVDVLAEDVRRLEQRVDGDA